MLRVFVFLRELRIFGFLFLGFSLFLVGCSGKKSTEGSVSPEYSVEQSFAEAQSLHDEGRFVKSAKSFGDIEKKHTYTFWGRKAAILAAEAHYESADYDMARQYAERYIFLYPSGEEVPYAMYLIGLSQKEKLSAIDRDQNPASEAIAVFELLIEQYPDSPFSEKAQKILGELHDRIVLKEMDVGYYYLHRSDYVAALNRFRGVLSNYSESRYVPEARMRIVEIYVAMGVLPEAESSGRKLCAEYPETSWCQSAWDTLSKQGIDIAEP